MKRPEIYYIHKYVSHFLQITISPRVIIVIIEYLGVIALPGMSYNMSYNHSIFYIL